ncbi:MAG TPA: metallophosphoesterase [Ktedonobacterales bacterium]|nr:metallophosphoesterase [Ktedonobacterales bacterium]
MRIALIADIHGNLVAFNTILDDIAREGVDQMVCLGDVAAFGPQPEEVVARLREVGCPVVMGDADMTLLTPGAARDGCAFPQPPGDRRLGAGAALTRRPRLYRGVRANGLYPARWRRDAALLPRLAAIVQRSHPRDDER